MNTIPRWLVLSILIGAALACYSVGFVPGFGLFLLFGAVFELSFWWKLFRKRNGNANSEL